MGLKQWLRSRSSRLVISSGKGRSKPRPGPRTAKPCVEILEDRLAPAGFIVNDVLDAAQLNPGTNNPADVNNLISLRSAIAAANLDAQNGVADTITFDPSLAAKTILLAAPLELSGVPSSGTATITIDASALSGGITVSGSSQVNVFLIDQGVNAFLNSLTITNGFVTSSSGGGIDNNGTLTLQNCDITGNSAMNFNGGGIENAGTLNAQNCDIINNSAQDANGGGIDNTGTLTLQNCTITGNSALNGDGGAISDGSSAANTTLSLQNCTISGNTAMNGDGGAITNFCTITRSGINFVLEFNAILTVQNCNFTNNSAQDGNGGGIYSSGVVTVTGSTFNSNSADLGGGGIYNSAGIVGQSGLATFIDSTLSGNLAPLGNGGGIYNDLVLHLAAETKLINSTVSGNSAQDGGGIYNSDLVEGVILQNTIVAGNNATVGLGSDLDDIANPGASPVNYALSSVNYSLVGNTAESGISGGSGNILDPVYVGLGSLANYGGATQTISLLPGSPAIDAGNSGLAVDAMGNPLATDQRGQPRVVNGTVDMGAFEVQPNDLVTISDFGTAVANGPDGVFQVGRYDSSAVLTVTVAITASTAPTFTLSPGSGIDPNDFHFDSTSQSVTFTIASGVQAADVDVGGIDPTNEADAISYSLQATLQLVSGSGGSGAYAIDPSNSTSTVLLGGGGLVVTNTNASGNGSLAQAVLNDNAVSVAGTITFAPGLTGTISLVATLGLSSLHSTAADPEEIDGPGANNLAISGNNAFGVVAVDAGVIAVLSGLTIAAGANSSANGGGISNDGTLTVQYCEIDGNSANEGGGIYNDATLTIIGSTLAGDSATANGGGIYNDVSSTAEVINSTLSGNSAPAGAGGGIYDASSIVVLTNCTLSGNSAGDGGGIYNDPSSSMTLQNAIVAGNTGSPAPDVEGNTGGTVNASFSMIGNSANSTIPNGSGNVLDPMVLGLGSLGYNGGATQTIPLLLGSPAINAGSNSLAVDAQGNPLATDQRGDPRIVDGTVDMGAFETLPDGTVVLTALAPVANNPGGVFQVFRYDSSGTLTATVAITASTAPSYTLSPGTGIDPATFSFSSNTASVTFTFATGARPPISKWGVLARPPRPMRKSIRCRRRFSPSAAAPVPALMRLTLAVPLPR